MLYKFVFFMIIALIVMVFLFKFLLYRLSPDISDSNQSNIIDKSSSQNLEDNHYISTLKNDDFIILDLRCDDKSCWNVDRKFENTSISLQYFKYIVINYKLNLLFEEIKNEIYTLTPFQNTLSKKTFAKLTDYHYQIPKFLKDGELSVIYKEVQKEKENIDSHIDFNMGNLAESGAANALVSGE